MGSHLGVVPTTVEGGGGGQMRPLSTQSAVMTVMIVCVYDENHNHKMRQYCKELYKIERL